MCLRPIGGTTIENAQPPSPRLLAALDLPADATEDDALARIAEWPKTGHEMMRREAALSRYLSDMMAFLATLRGAPDAPTMGDDQKPE